MRYICIEFTRFDRLLDRFLYLLWFADCLAQWNFSVNSHTQITLSDAPAPPPKSNIIRLPYSNNDLLVLNPFIFIWPLKIHWVFYNTRILRSVTASPEHFNSTTISCESLRTMWCPLSSVSSSPASVKMLRITGYMSLCTSYSFSIFRQGRFFFKESLHFLCIFSLYRHLQ